MKQDFLSPFRAIFFDAGGTLLGPYPSVGEIYCDVASRYGLSAEAKHLEKLFHESWFKRDRLQNLASHSSEKIEKDWWRHLVNEVFSQVGTIERFEDFFNELYDVFGHPSSWRLYPETEYVLAELKKQGKKLGIVSNWDSRLFKLCSGLGLEKYFDFVIASAVFGAAKPSPKIFEEALKKAGVLPHEAVHVGDSLEDDIHGAKRLGIEAVLIDRSVSGKPRDREKFLHIKTITHLEELL
ncbi:MAG: HAD-IA family hydrolase [Candidatus Omnitrophica bacterium]|nr:HAD-IA family hydrolase [Candidatus Omnitrophota bacterium]